MTNPSIKILPYIDSGNRVAPKSNTDTNSIKSSTGSASASAPVSASSSGTSFSEHLEAAKRATAAVAIDSLVLASGSGAVDPNVVQNFFDSHNIDIQVPFAGTSSTVYSSTDIENNTNVVPATPETTETTVTTETTNATESTENSASTANTDGTETTETADSSSTISSGALTCSDTMDAYFMEASELYHIDIKLLKSVAKVESNFDSSATSSVGAMGVMQLMPATAEELGVEWPYDARENILGGAKLLSQFLERYNGDVELTLAAYNSGPGTVAKYDNQVPPSVQGYVDKVLSYYNS